MTDELIETAPGANTAPPVLLLQGTGGTNEEMLAFGRRLVPQSPLLTIGGRLGEGAQRQYFQQTAAGPIDPQQVADESAWLGASVRQICQNHRWDVDHLITVGYSNGAAMGSYGLRTGDLPGTQAVLFHPLWVATPRLIERPKLNIWLSAGQRDPLVTVATVQQVAADCRRTKAAVTLYQTGGSHMLTPQEVRAAKNWLGKND